MSSSKEDTLLDDIARYIGYVPIPFPYDDDISPTNPDTLVMITTPEAAAKWTRDDVNMAAIEHFGMDQAPSGDVSRCIDWLHMEGIGGSDKGTGVMIYTDNGNTRYHTQECTDMACYGHDSVREAYANDEKKARGDKEKRGRGRFGRSKTSKNTQNTPRACNSRITLQASFEDPTDENGRGGNPLRAIFDNAEHSHWNALTINDSCVEDPNVTDSEVKKQYIYTGRNSIRYNPESGKMVIKYAKPRGVTRFYHPLDEHPLSRGDSTAEEASWKGRHGHLSIMANTEEQIRDELTRTFLSSFDRLRLNGTYNQSEHRGESEIDAAMEVWESSRERKAAKLLPGMEDSVKESVKSKLTRMETAFEAGIEVTEREEDDDGVRYGQVPGRYESSEGDSDDRARTSVRAMTRSIGNIRFEGK